MSAADNSLPLPKSGEEQRAEELVAQMSLEEKSLLLSGDGWWRTHSIERLGIPAIALSDGPHGLRLSNLSRRCNLYRSRWGLFLCNGRAFDFYLRFNRLRRLFGLDFF